MIQFVPGTGVCDSPVRGWRVYTLWGLHEGFQDTTPHPHLPGTSTSSPNIQVCFDGGGSLPQTQSFPLPLGLRAEGGGDLSGRAGQGGAGWGTLAMGALTAALPLLHGEVHLQ